MKEGESTGFGGRTNQPDGERGNEGNGRIQADSWALSLTNFVMRKTSGRNQELSFGHIKFEMSKLSAGHINLKFKNRLPIISI